MDDQEKQDPRTDNDTPDPTRVLFVDDESDIEIIVRHKLRREVRRAQYEIEFALNGEEALKRLAQWPCEVLVTDINMPVMNGLELLERLRERGEEVKSVVVSAYGDMDNIRAAMNLGAFDFVTKPVDFDDLKRTVARAAEQQRKWRTGRTDSAREEIERSVRRHATPEGTPSDGRFSTHAAILAGEQIGGEFTDVVRLVSKVVRTGVDTVLPHGEKIGLISAQVAGAGVEPALFMMSSRRVLKGAAIGSGSIGEMLLECERIISQDNPDGRAVQLVYAMYDPDKGTLAYGGSAKWSPLLIGTDGGVRRLPMSEGAGIGINQPERHEEQEHRIGPGETLIVHGDGLANSAGPSREAMQELASAVAEARPRDAHEAAATIEGVLDRMRGGTTLAVDASVLILTRHDG